MGIATWGYSDSNPKPPGPKPPIYHLLKKVTPPWVVSLGFLPRESIFSFPRGRRSIHWVLQARVAYRSLQGHSGGRREHLASWHFSTFPPKKRTSHQNWWVFCRYLWRKNWNISNLWDQNAGHNFSESYILYLRSREIFACGRRLLSWGCELFFFPQMFQIINTNLLSLFWGLKNINMMLIYLLLWCFREDIYHKKQITKSFWMSFNHAFQYGPSKKNFGEKTVGYHNSKLQTAPGFLGSFCLGCLQIFGCAWVGGILRVGS